MKRMLAMLLAVLMLAAPLSGLAEGQDYTTAALEAGRRVSWTVSLADVAADMTGEPAVDQVIADLLNALVISGYMQGDEVYYAIGMKQDRGGVADMLTLGMAAAGGDLYLLSNIIGGSIVVSADEVVPLLQRLVDMFVLLGMIPENEAESVKAQLPEMWEMASAELVSSMSASFALDDLDMNELNYDAVLAALETVAGKMVQGEPAPLPRNCDAAVSMLTCTMTPEDMNALLASMVQFLKDNPALAEGIAAEIDFDNIIAPEMSSVTGENVDFMTFLDMLQDELPEEEISEGDVVIRIWQDENGEPVAMDMNLVSDGEVVADSVQMNYHRLTMNEVVAYSFMVTFPEGDITLDVVVGERNVKANLAIAEAGETRVLLQVDYTDRSEGALQACDVVLDVTVTEASVNMSGTFYDLTGYQEALNTVEYESVNMNFAFRSDVLVNDADFTGNQSLTVSVDGKEYVTVLFASESAEPGASIADGNVVRPAALSDADFANWFVNAYTALFSWLQNALLALPASVMNLLNSGY